MKTISANLYRILWIIPLLGLLACVKETEYETLSGVLMGRVYYYEKGTYNFSKEGGVEVTLEGSDPLKKTYTEPDGSYQFDDVKSGTYNIIFNKEGYCQRLIMGYNFVGGTKPSYAGEVFLYEIIKARVDSVKLEVYKYNDQFKIHGRIIACNTAGIYNFGFIYFINNSSNVSYTNYISCGDLNRYVSDSCREFITELDPVKFPVGSTAWVIVYPYSGAYYNYYDLDLDKYIFYTVNRENASDIVSVKIEEPELTEYQTETQNN